VSVLVALRPQAEADLSAIWDYTVETWSEQQAVTYLSGINAVFQKLSEFPEMARLRSEFSLPIRIMPYQRHQIIYCVEDDHIDVLRVVHSRANWAAFLLE